MFDSFYIGNKEIQTKKLDNSLQSYRLGSTVPHYLDKHGNLQSSFYIIENSYPDTDVFYGLIVLSNIFIDYVISDKDNIVNDTESIFQLHKKRPDYSFFKLSEILENTINPERKKDNRQLRDIKYAVQIYENLETSSNTFRFLPSNIEKDLIDNKLPLNEVISKIMLGGYSNEDNDDNYGFG